MRKLALSILPLIAAATCQQVLAKPVSHHKMQHPAAEQHMQYFLSGPYGAQLNAAGFYGTDDHSYGMFDALVPLVQKHDDMLFFDGRYVGMQDSQYETYLGLGYRWLAGKNSDYLFTTALFYDRKKSLYDDVFNQLTVTGELKTGNFNSVINAYIPVGTRTYDHTSGSSTIHNNSLGGFNGELGYVIPQWMDLRFYLGGYYFKGNNTATMAGPMASINLNLLKPWTEASKWRPHLKIETSLQHDKPRGTIWYVGARASISIGSNHPEQMHGMEKLMTAFIRRMHIKDMTSSTSSSTVTEGRETNVQGGFAIVNIN